MNVIIYDTKTNKIKRVINSNNPESIKVREGESKLINDKITNFNQTDIRVYKSDGSLKTIKEQVKEKIIKLDKNQIVDEENNTVRTLYEDDAVDQIEMIKRGIIKINKYKKLDKDEEGNDILIDKTPEELHNDKILSDEDYDSYIISLRQASYNQELDSKRAELLDKVLKDLGKKGLLSAEEQKELKELDTLRADIKARYKKSNQ